MRHTIRKSHEGVDIVLDGRFTFADHEAFRGIIDEVHELAGACCRVDLKAVPYIDSAALGMLLLLRERLESRKCAIALRGGGPQVKEVFRVAKLGKWFKIED